tara:strand:+ start:172 stop:567 length:396 start_codon:yes stop_codon:yes gene_type:complete
MGFNPIKMVKKALKSNNLLVKLAAAALVFYLFSHLLRFVGLEGMSNGDVVTYFHMKGCPHCTKFNPEWDKFTAGSKVKTRKVESKEMTPKDKKLGVSGFPTVVLVGANGEKKKEFKGERTKAGLEKWVKSL